MEINRIEADRHLIGVGRELESLDGKAKATLPVHVTEDGLRFFKRDPEGEWERLYDAEQAHLTVGTLQAVVDYLNQNPDGLDLGKLLVHVCDVTTVKVMSIPFGGWKQRATYMRADAVVPTGRRFAAKMLRATSQTAIRGGIFTRLWNASPKGWRPLSPKLPNWERKST